MFIRPNARYTRKHNNKSETQEKPVMQIQNSELSYTQMGASFLLGAFAAYYSTPNNFLIELKSLKCLNDIIGKKDIFIGLAIGSLVTAIFIGANSLYSRFSSMQSVRQLKFNDDTNSDKLEIIPIKNEHMDKVDPDNLPDGQLFQLAFCFKRGFADILEGGLLSKYIMEQSPFKHSSIMFIPLDIIGELQKLEYDEQGEFLTERKRLFVCGRQSIKYHEKNPRGTFFQTTIDNEANYELFPGSSFESMLTKCTFTGKEIKFMIQRVNDLICDSDDQRCTMIFSNCYSASICMIAIAVEALHQRHINHLERSKQFPYLNEMHPHASHHTHSQLMSLCAILAEVTQHNQGQGVVNNATVLKQVNIALEIYSLFDKKASLALTQELSQSEKLLSCKYRR